LNRFFSLPSGAVKTAPPFYAITENPGRMPFLIKITKGSGFLLLPFYVQITPWHLTILL